MSGGRYSNLWNADAPHLFENSQHLATIRDRLSELGHNEAAIATGIILLQMEDLCKTLEYWMEKKRLDEVWKAIEWLDSGDWGLEQVNEAVGEFLAAMQAKNVKPEQAEAGGV